ncbi:MAG: hydrogenase formation protein HypD [Prochlorotrichaceae cyanobacterium]|jgi:hydrogenase expression/formation protein HypD
MKFVDEYRDQNQVQQYAQALQTLMTRPWTIMEVCGGQTHSIVKYGLDTLLPPDLTLIHGPGCPVCVTSSHWIDGAIALAQDPKVILCSFGDMLRVPGSRTVSTPGAPADLLSAKAQGADVRGVYSPLDALKLAQTNPERTVIFFAVGFETTAPSTAMAVYQAARLGLTNFALLVSHVRVPPAIVALMSSPDCQVQGFLAAGHVCTVMGTAEYDPLVETFQVPIVVTGFEPLDIMQGIYHCVSQLEEGKAIVTNQYKRSVKPEGNPTARQLIDTVFQPVDRDWRGIGVIPDSGLELRSAYQQFDARQYLAANWETTLATAEENPCISGLVLRGVKKPQDCPAFGTACTPDHPLGAPMVSSEGACAAYYRYRPN